MKTYYKTFVSCEFKWQIKRFSKKAKHWDMEDIMIHKYLEVEKGYRSWKVLPFIKIPSPSDCCPPSWICHIGRAVHRKENLGSTIFVVLETKWPIRSMIWSKPGSKIQNGGRSIDVSLVWLNFPIFLPVLIRNISLQELKNQKWCFC